MVIGILAVVPVFATQTVIEAQMQEDEGDIVMAARLYAHCGGWLWAGLLAVLVTVAPMVAILWSITGDLLSWLTFACSPVCANVRRCWRLGLFDSAASAAGLGVDACLDSMASALHGVSWHFLLARSCFGRRCATIISSSCCTSDQLDRHCCASTTIWNERSCGCNTDTASGCCAAAAAAREVCCTRCCFVCLSTQCFCLYVVVERVSYLRRRHDLKRLSGSWHRCSSIRVRDGWCCRHFLLSVHNMCAGWRVLEHGLPVAWNELLQVSTVH